jgi:3-oxoacyl-[acyl-carrier protein] reductase
MAPQADPIRTTGRREEKDEMEGLNGRVALVTGGGQGIGLSIGTRLAAEGARVVLADINEETAKEAAEALGIKVDVASYESAKATVEAVAEQCGSLDILVNNAGITRDALLVRMSEADWDAVIDVNLKGAYNCTKAATLCGPMVRRRWGRIVSVASVIGLMGNAAQSNYAASKSGLIALMKSVARELGRRGVTANAVAPGYIETAMTASLPEEVREGFLTNIPLRRAGQPEDIARAVAFLASEDAAYITGHVLTVDGGMVMH